MEYKNFENEIKQADDENLTISHFVSTEEIDRGGDVMRADGMRIEGKPVVLLQHGKTGIGAEPIGKPLEIRVDTFRGKKGVVAKTQFFNDDLGRRLYEKVRDGFMPNFSIGYMVDESKEVLKDGRFHYKDVTRWRLLEYSVVGVPMCAGATTFKDVGGLFFKILPDGEACGCAEPCKGDVKCAGHSTKRPPRLRFQLVDSRPPKADPKVISAIAQEVIREHVRKEVRRLEGKVD